MEDQRELEEDQKIQNDQPNDKPTEFRIKTTEPKTKRAPKEFFLSPSSRDNATTLPTSGRFGYNSHMGTPKDPIDRIQYSKTIEDISIKNEMKIMENVVPIGSKGIKVIRKII